MISFAAPMPVGNAAKILWSPSAGTLRTRLLRKVTDDVASQDDPDALVVYDGDGKSVIDIQSLTNGTQYFYRAFEFDGATWAGSPSVSVTPAASVTAVFADPLTLVRDRLQCGLKVEVAAGRLKHATGAIPVLTAPPEYEQTKFPVVTVHLRNDAPSVRAVGEAAFPDEFDADSDLWSESEGWLSGVSLDILTWSLNPDERIALRKAIKKIIAGNLAVFDQAGMVQIEFSQSDVEDFESYNAPVYQTMCPFSCLAPFAVAAEESAVDDVTVTATMAA